MIVVPQAATEMGFTRKMLLVGTGGLEVNT